ncbi:MAG: DNA polymerase/3'-5' exonuclease PolX, partial [Bacilli bacterium]
TDEATLLVACETGKVEALAGFGKKTAEKIADAIKNNRSSDQRLPFHSVVPLVDAISEALSSCEEIIRFSVAGSYRRHEETVKDLDWVISTEKVEAVRAMLLALPNIEEVIGAGETKVSVRFHEPVAISCDFRLVRDEHFPTTLHHFTGSKDHNVRLRQLAKQRGESISEYGVRVEETGETLTFPTESAFFQHFNLPFIPPSMRVGGMEFEQDETQAIVQLEDIVSDLHMHTTWSDGAYSISNMADYALEYGYTHIAITDHGQFLKVANGLTPERLLQQGQEIDAWNSADRKIKVLKGIEMDILPDGSLDFDDEILATLDWVVASIHSGFQGTEEEIMRRMQSALSNRYVDMIAHPTGRVIGRREGYAVNIAQLVEACAATGKILELNANPKRWDLRKEHLEMAVAKRVPIALNTDAHNREMLGHMRYVIALA